MARILLAPVVDEHLLRDGGRCPSDVRESRQSPGHHATRVRRVGAVVVEDGRSSARRRVVGVEDVQRVGGREVRVQRHPQQPTVPEVVHLGTQVGHDVRRGVGQTRVGLDDAALLRNEDSPVGRERHREWLREPTEYDVLAEVGRQGDRVGRWRERQADSQKDEQQSGICRAAVSRYDPETHALPSQTPSLVPTPTVMQIQPIGTPFGRLFSMSMRRSTNPAGL